MEDGPVYLYNVPAATDVRVRGLPVQTEQEVGQVAHHLLPTAGQSFQDDDAGVRYGGYTSTPESPGSG